MLNIQSRIILSQLQIISTTLKSAHKRH